MSYHTSTRPALQRYGAHRAAQPLGIWPFSQIATFIVGSSAGEQTECLDKANVKVAPIDAQINDLSKNWHPSGYYTPEQMGTLIDQTLLALRSAGDHVRGAPTATGDASQMISEATGKIARRGQDSLDFIRAKNTAVTSGIKIIDAPGLRRWVISSLQDAGYAHTTAFVQECAMPGLASAIIAYQRVFDGAAGIIKSIVGVAIDVAKAVGSTVLHLPDTISTMFTYLKWGVIGGAGLWVFLEVKKRQKKA
jgi:hypothetical protein